MAETKILNLDEFIDAQPERVVIWRGQNHPVEGMTGLAYLKFIQARGALEKAQKAGDEAQQWEQNLRIIGIVTPTLAELRDELLRLRLPALNKLVEFIMAEITGDETAAAEAGSDQQPGE